jgi:hypothetical protein
MLCTIHYSDTKTITTQQLKKNLDLGKNLTTKKANYKLINGIVSACNDKLIVGGSFYALAKVCDCVN